MNGTVTAGSSGEDPVPADRALALMEQELFSGNAGIIASNLGFKLSETVRSDGHLKDARAICTRIRDWYSKRGERGHAALIEEYGRMVGTEIWTGALCQQTK